MDIVLFVVVGLIAGWSASLIMSGHGMGIFGDVILGIIGAFVGGWIFSQVGMRNVSLLGEIGIAAIGAMLVIGFVRMITGNYGSNRRHSKI